MPTASRYALISLGVALAVLSLKTLAYGITGSLALLSDALESVINVVVAGAAFIALRVSSQPADDNHPFGHHKAEYFSAVLEGTLIMLAALAIFREAYLHLFNPKPIQELGLGAAVNLVASAMNALWGWRLLRIGKDLRSPALIADARHVLTDVISSVGVVGGVLAVIWTGWIALDAVVAALAAVYILFSGWALLKDSVGGLMDQAVDPSQLTLIQDCISKEAQGAIEAHDLRTRHAGPVTFIQFHLVVPALMSVSDAHDICDRLESRLHDIVPDARVTIHVEPENKAKHEGIIIS